MQLKTYCVLAARENKKQMRLGYCSTCGYSGYIDRPAKEWMDEFYKEKWDGGEWRAGGEEVSLAATQRSAVHYVENLAVDTNRSVCDIGCGYGRVLKEFEKIGFRNLIGVESSRFRVYAAKARYGYKILEGNFESTKVQEELSRSSPIGVLFSYHVLEHTYHPSEIIKAASALQNNGDYFILSTPNFVNEPVPTTLFWLPHLHSFTPASLERLLNTHGYEVVGALLEYPENITCISKKVASPKAHYIETRGDVSGTKEKILQFFLCDHLRPQEPYIFSWQKQKGKYMSMARELFLPPLLDRASIIGERVRRYVIARLLGKFTKKYSLALTIEKGGRALQEEAPIEVHFDGNIQLLVYDR